MRFFIGGKDQFERTGKKGGSAVLPPSQTTRLEAPVLSISMILKTEFESVGSVPVTYSCHVRSVSASGSFVSAASNARSFVNPN